MNDDLLRELQELQQYAAGLQEVAVSMQAPAMRPLEREDHAGAFMVRLDEGGLPDRIQVASDWAHRVDPEDIGQAVLEAYGAAAGARMEAWAEHLQRSDWQQRILRTGADGAGQTPEQWPAQREGPPPSMDEVAEAAITALRSATISPAVATDRHDAPDVNAARRAVIALHQGRMTSCEVDASWARRQSSRSLAGVLGRALERARDDLQQGNQEREAARAAQMERTQALFGDALQILKNPQRFSGM